MASNHNTLQYSDLITEQGSTCWEANVFASKYDPFYEWIRSSSLAAAFKTVAVERISTAYQRASVWKVTGSLKDDNSTFYFNSPDPHILGGIISHNKNWISEMTINWGLSIRLCLHTDSNHVDNTCMKTTPVILSDQFPGFGALLTEIPYAMGSTTTVDPDKNSHASFGSYLTNFASSARREEWSEKVTKGELQAQRYWRYVYHGKECKKTSPILYSADVVSYLAFPSIQCGCIEHPKICVIGNNLRSDENSRLRLKLNTSACETSESFWHLQDNNNPGNGNSNNLTRFIFAAYSPAWNLSLSLRVSFNYNLLELDRTLQWRPLVQLSSCIDRWLIRQSIRPVKGDGILKSCSKRGSVSLSFLDGESHIFSRYRIVHYKAEIVESIVPVDMKDDAYCGIGRGQADRDICALQLDDIYTREQVQALFRSVIGFSKVAEVKRFSRKEWKKGSSTRSQVSIEIVTALLAFAVTVTGMLSKRMQDVEDILVNSAEGFRTIINRTVGMPVLRFLLRSSIILTTAGWSMFDLYKNIEDLEAAVPQIATSGTILQQSNGISFLVTTTSNVQVSPKWFTYFSLCTGVGVVLVIVLVYVYSLMVYIEREEQRVS